MTKEFRECAVCGHIYLPDRPSRNSETCSRACARKLEAMNRKQPVIDEILSAIKTDLERILKK